MSNKVISIEYKLTDPKTNEELDSNVGKAPLDFISGMNHIIPGLESELVKMSADEKADILVKAKDGYGEYNEEAIQNVPKEQFAGIELVEGMTLYGTGEGGQTVQVTVKNFNDESVTIDYNHPLAGKDLMFSVTLLSLRDATEEEVQTGVVGGLAAMSGGGCCGGGSCSSDSEHSHSHGEGGCCSSEGGEHKHEDGHTCCGSGKHCS